MTGFLLIAILKAVFNPYPTLHEINVIIVCLLMNINLAIHYVEGFYLLISILCYSFVSIAIAWNTWLNRFSGNANFYYA